MHEFTWDRGVHLRGSVLWMDSTRYSETNFVSSARVEESWRHSRALCTERTRALLRVSRKPFQALVAPFGRRISLGPIQLTLLPSGFMPGSAQLLMESDKGSTLYVNHMSLEPHRLAEPPQFATADTLIIKAAYGRPDFSFPPWEETLAMVVEAVREALAAEETPVLLCSAVGKAQEVVRRLVDEGLAVSAHRSITRYNKAYRALGFDPGLARQFKGGIRHDEVLIYPDRLRFSPAVRRLKRARLFWLSGLSRAPDAIARLRVDEGIPLAGHLDHAGLLHFIDITRVKRVHTVGGWANEFAEYLGKRGIEASVLQQDTQLSLF